MRLRPFVPHDPVEDITDGVNCHYSDFDAVDDQTILNKNLPELERPTSADITGEIEVNET